MQILNAQTTADTAPNVASIGGHDFEIGPVSGITKKEYREFEDWRSSDEAKAKGFEGAAARFMKFHIGRSSGRE